MVEEKPEDTIKIFKLLVYTKYITLGRCIFVDDIDEKKEFLILQGSQRTICRTLSRINEIENGKIGDLYNEFELLSENLSNFGIFPNTKDDDLSSKDFVGVTVEKTFPVDQPNDKTEVPPRKSFDFMNIVDRTALDVLLKRHKNSNIDKEFIYESFLYTHPSDSSHDVNLNADKPIKINIFSTLSLNENLPNIGSICKEIMGYRLEYKSRLLPSHSNVSSSIEASDLNLLKLNSGTSEITHSSFDELVQSIHFKLCRFSLSLNIKLLKLGLINLETVSEEMYCLLKSLLHDVSNFPCYYDKWIKLLTMEEMEHSNLQLVDVYNILDLVLDFAISSRLNNIIDLIIDLSFSISLRNPDVCDILNTSLKLSKNILLPSIVGYISTLDDSRSGLDGYPDPTESPLYRTQAPRDHSRNSCTIPGTADINKESVEESDTKREERKGECVFPTSPVFTASPESREFPESVAEIWLPQAPIAYDSAWDLHYLSLNYPILVNCSTNGRLKKVSTSIPGMGTYIVRLELLMRNFKFKNIYEHTNEYIFKLVLSDLKEISFLTNGQVLILIDENVTLFNLDPDYLLSLELFFDNRDLLIFLNGLSFYKLEASTQTGYTSLQDIIITVEYDDEIVKLHQHCNLSPSLRKELVRWNVMIDIDPDAMDKSPVNYLFMRQMYITALTSSLHNVVARIRNSLAFDKDAHYSSSSVLLKFMRLLFELLSCTLDTSAALNSVNLVSINAITLWRMISETIISLLSIIRILFSIPLHITEDIPLEFTQVISRCLIGSFKYECNCGYSEYIDKYHLRLDLIILKNIINVFALHILSLNPSISKNLFHFLPIDVISEVFTSMVQTSLYFTFDLKMLAINNALINLNDSDCIAIFTKRAISHATSRYTRAKANNVDIDWEDNYWCRLIFGFLESEKDSISNYTTAQPIDQGDCNCNSKISELSLLAPSLTSCSICLRKCFNFWSSVSSLNYHLKQMLKSDVYYYIPKPQLLLSKLLLKHGMIFLCIDAASCVKCSADINFSHQSFGDWKHGLIISCKYEALKNIVELKGKTVLERDVIPNSGVSTEGRLTTQSQNTPSSRTSAGEIFNAIPYFRLFKNDNITFFEYTLEKLLKFNECMLAIILDNVYVISKYFPDEFGVMLHNFTDTLSVVDVLSYFTEFLDHLLTGEDKASFNDLILPCINILPLVLKVIITTSRLVKEYSLHMDYFSPFMNFIVLQFHSLTSIFGKIVTSIYFNSHVCMRDALLKTKELAEVPQLDKIKENITKLPRFVLCDLDYSFKQEYPICNGLRRLLLLLQDLKYDDDKHLLHFKYIPGVNDFIDGRDNRDVRTNELSKKIEDMDECVMKIINGYTFPFPCYLRPTMLQLLSLFSHLLDLEQSSLLSALKIVDGIVIKLMKKIQSIHILYPDLNDLDYEELRGLYLQDVNSRCLWIKNNTSVGCAKKGEGKDVPTDRKLGRSLGRNHAQTDTATKFKRSMSDLNVRRPYPKEYIRSSITERFNVDRIANNHYLYMNHADRIDINYEYAEVILFILNGPPSYVCEAELISEKISSLSNYAMLGCINTLASIFIDVKFINTGPAPAPSSTFNPLIVDLMDKSNYTDIIIGKDLQNTLALYWYSVLKIVRTIVLNSITTESNPYTNITCSYQKRVLATICDWYLTCGITNVDSTRCTRDVINAWIRMALSLFSLLYFAGAEPMSNIRYAYPIFQHMLSILQPLPMSKLRVAISNNMKNSTYAIELALITFISDKFQRHFNNSMDNMFHCFRARKFYLKDTIKVKNGTLYLWIKRSSTHSDIYGTIENPRVEFRYFWHFPKIDAKFDYNKPNLHFQLYNFEIQAPVDPSFNKHLYSVDTNDIIIWNMSTPCNSITEASFSERGNHTLILHIEVGAVKLPIYLSTQNVVSSKSGEIELALVNYLGGKLEIEGINGNWSQVLGFTRFDDLFIMRCHFYNLLKLILWVSLSSNLDTHDDSNMKTIEDPATPSAYDRKSSTPLLPCSTTQLSCCLIKLILSALCRLTDDLPKYDNCKCIFDLSCNDYVSVKYYSSDMDLEHSSKALDGIISKQCSTCCSNIIYSRGVENYWSLVLTLLIQNINSTKQYPAVYYILNCLLTTFTLSEEEIDLFLSLPLLGPLFCELFLSCIRKLGQESLSNSDYTVEIEDDTTATLASTTLHGMFLYRWLPPLQQAPLESIYASTRENFHSVVMSKGFKKNVCKLVDSNNDPFITLPHSEHFVTHRASSDFEADINGNILHITRATNMGGIVLFRIPTSIGTTTTQGNVNFLILSPGRFGITVAPADCIFGTVSDLFDRNDVVGFMTTSCQPFTNDVFAATINYRIGDVLSAYFTVDQQEDGQICLRTELLIAGNSIGSVLEVTYDPITQNDTTRRMSLAFIFQDPLTIVHNGMTQNVEHINFENLVTRDTQTSFRSNTASEHIPIISSIDGPPDLDTPSLRDGTSSSRSHPILTSDEEFVTDEEDMHVDSFSTLDNIPVSDWDINYDIVECKDDAVFKNEAVGLCKDDMWFNLIKEDKCLPKSAIIFADSIQVYQSILMTNLHLLSGLKNEIISQMCASFTALYHSLKEDHLDLDEIRNAFSWLAVLGCDYDSSSWKDKKIVTSEKSTLLSHYNLPWNLGSTSTNRICMFKLNYDHCEKLLRSLSLLLSLNCISSTLYYTTSRESAASFLLDPQLMNKSLLIALGSKTLLVCALIAKVMAQKGYKIEYQSTQDQNYQCISQLFDLIYSYLIDSTTHEEFDKERIKTILDMFGIVEGGMSPADDKLVLGADSLSYKDAQVQTPSLDYYWYLIYERVKNDKLNMENVKISPATTTCKSIADLHYNTRMFSTCDYTYHCGTRIPSFRRHVMRRSLYYKLCKYDVHDLLSALLLLSPQFFLDCIKGDLTLKVLRLFRCSVIHCTKAYDFNSPDYWNWVKITRGKETHERLDVYSKMVDPLYGWQRLIYMSAGHDLSDMCYSEFLFSLIMPMYNKKYSKLLHNVHWMLDMFIRHPLCPLPIRERFASYQVWVALHTLMINSTALPCKLATVASRLSALIIPRVSAAQIREMLLVTHYCGTSAFHRVLSVCHFYGTLDLDTFTNLDLKRHDHSTKLATATIVHQFVSTFALLLEQPFIPSFKPDEFTNIAQYIYLARNKVFSKQFIKQVLAISEPLDTKTHIPENTTKALVTSSSTSKSLLLSFKLKGKKKRVIFSLDKDFNHIFKETYLNFRRNITLTIGKTHHLDFHPVKITKGTHATLKVGFLVGGAGHMRMALDTKVPHHPNHPPPSITDTGDSVYMLVDTDQVVLISRGTELVWNCKGVNTVYNFRGRLVKGPFVSLVEDTSNPSSVDVDVEEVVDLPLTFCFYKVDEKVKIVWNKWSNGLICSMVQRSGISLSNSLPLSPFAPFEQTAENDPRVIELHSDMEVSRVVGDLKTGLQFVQKCLPFNIGIRVNIIDNFYFGVKWNCNRIIWYSNGDVKVPSEPPFYLYSNTGEMTIKGVPYTKSDYISIQFKPEVCALFFYINSKLSMTFNFKTFYIPRIKLNLAGPVERERSKELQSDLIHYLLSSDDKALVAHVDYLINEGIAKCILENTYFEANEEGTDLEPIHYIHNPIYVAALLGKFDAITTFSKVPSLNFDAKSGPELETPLMAAVKHGHSCTISYLVCVHSVDINAKDINGQTPLMKSLMHNPDNTLLLIELGANIHETDVNGMNTFDRLFTHSSSKSELHYKLLDHFKLSMHNPSLTMRSSIHPTPIEGSAPGPVDTGGTEAKTEGISGKGCVLVSNTWPGLLASSNVIISSDDFVIDTSSFTLCHYTIDGKNVNISPDFVEKNTLSSVDLKDDVSMIIALKLENIRKSIILHASSVIDNLHHLLSSVDSNDMDLKDMILKYISGFVDDIRIHCKWSRFKIIRRFVAISTTYVAKLVQVSDRLQVIVSFLYYERLLMNIKLLSGGNRLKSAALQSYERLLSNSNLFDITYCIHTNSYLISTHCDALFDLFKEKVTNNYTIHPIPEYSADVLPLSISSNVHIFDQIRLEMNMNMDKSLDYTIRCLIDLLNNSGSILRLIVSIISKCTSKLQIQGYLPPVGSPDWEGIHLSFDQILSSITKIRTLISDKIKYFAPCDVEIYVLLQHIYKIVDNLGLKHAIRLEDVSNTQRLNHVIQKLNINVRNFESENSLTILNLSNINPNDYKTLTPDDSSETDVIFLSFCYILVRDRIELLDQVNDIFKVVTPIAATVFNQPIVEYKPISELVLYSKTFYDDLEDRFGELSALTMRSSIHPTPIEGSAPGPVDTGGTEAKRDGISGKDANFTNRSLAHGTGIYDRLSQLTFGLNIGPPDQTLHWSVYNMNQNLIRRTVINDMYNKIYLSLQSLTGDRPYFSIKVDRGISSTSTNLKHTLWYQSSTQILNSNPNILRAKNSQRPFMVIFKGEGSTDFGGPFQEFLTCLSNEVMDPLTSNPRLDKWDGASIMCSNSINNHGNNRDTVLFKFAQPIHPMTYLSEFHNLDTHKYIIKCTDLGLSCSSGCCSPLPLLSSDDAPKHDFRHYCKCGGSELYSEVCNQHTPLELSMYEALGRIFAMCVCMLNPLNIAINPIIWKKMLGYNITLSDLADYDKISVDLLWKLLSGYNEDYLEGLTFNLESNEGIPTDLIQNGSNVAVNKDNLDTFIKLAALFRATQSDTGCTWLTRGFNAVIPIGRLRMLLDYKSFEFMVCGDSVIDLAVLRAHTVSTSIYLKRDLFDVLTRFNNDMLKLFLRFVSGRSRLPHSDSEWCMYVEYSPITDDDVDSRLPTSATCSFRLLIPHYSSQEIMYKRLIYAIENCIVIDLDVPVVHDEMQLSSS